MFNTTQFNQVQFNQSLITRIIGYLKMKVVNRTETEIGTRLRMKLSNRR